MIPNKKNVLSVHLLTHWVLPPELPPRVIKGTRSKQALKIDRKPQKRLNTGKEGVEDVKFKWKRYLKKHYESFTR